MRSLPKASAASLFSRKREKEKRVIYFLASPYTSEPQNRWIIPHASSSTGVAAA